MSDTRQRFVESTIHLVENQGYHATGLNQIISESGAPKGSLYHYFPDGKEELVGEAVKQAGNNLIQLIRENLAEDVSIGNAVRDFIYGVAKGVETTNFRSGGPLTAIAMETATTSERLNLACRQAFSEIQAAFAFKLETAGFPKDQAGTLSTFITSAIEGGIILSRTHHSGDSLRQVADQLHTMLEGTLEA